MDKSFTLMKIAAVAIIVAVVVAMAIMVTDGGKARFNKATRQMNSAASEFDNPALQAYDGATITGAEVIKAIDKYASKDVGIRVRAGKDTEKLYIRSYTDENNLKLIGKTATDLQSEKINESAIFIGRLIRDNNNEIQEIIFEQSTTDKIELVDHLNGAIMSGIEAKEAMNKYKESLLAVWFWRNGCPDDISVDNAISYIDSSKCYRCFSRGTPYEISFNVIDLSAPPLLYDGAIITGQEMLDLLTGSCNTGYYYAYTSVYPGGYGYHSLNYNSAAFISSIDPSSKFKAECRRSHVYGDGDGKPITGLNFYQIIE